MNFTTFCWIMAPKTQGHQEKKKKQLKSSHIKGHYQQSKNVLGKWHSPVIPATGEAEAGGSQVVGQS